MLNKYFPKSRDTWSWSRAAYSDVANIVKLAQDQFQGEVDHIFNIDPYYYAYKLESAIASQNYYKDSQLLMVAKNKDTKELMAYSWAHRGQRADYSLDEMAEAKFIHCDLSLTPRQRVTIVAQALHQMMIWAYQAKVPVLVSTSIRADQKAFLHLHEELGFTVRGSIAYLKLNEIS
jgi:hypothetical protein